MTITGSIAARGRCRSEDEERKGPPKFPGWQKVVGHFCHGKALESPPVQVPRTTAVIVHVVPADVRHTHPAHQPSQRHVGPRPDDNMPMVGHQAISQKIHRITLESLDQHSLAGVVVGLVVKQSQETVATIEDVIDHPCFDRPSGSWHSGRFADGPLSVNISDVPCSLSCRVGKRLCSVPDFAVANTGRKGNDK